MPGIEPGAFHMRSERSTAELHPRRTARVPVQGTYINVGVGELFPFPSLYCVSTKTRGITIQFIYSAGGGWN